MPSLDADGRMPPPHPLSELGLVGVCPLSTLPLGDFATWGLCHSGTLPDFWLGATHRWVHFGTHFEPFLLRNDRFYKGLAPKRGWDLGPAGRPPAGQPCPAKRFFDSRLNQNNGIKIFFESTLFLIRSGRPRSSPKVVCQKVFGRKSTF